MRKIKIMMKFIFIFIMIIGISISVILYASHRNGIRNAENLYYISNNMTKIQVDSVMQTKPENILFIDSFEIYYYESPFLCSEDVSIFFNLNGIVVKTEFE